MKKAVSSAQLRKNFGRYQDSAQRGPIQVTRRGRPSVVIMSVATYERLRRLDRQVLAVTELSEAEIAAIEAAEIPAKHRYSIEDLE